ncbi:MAG: hypothetical protein LC768_09730 [Acidobacteria bacterium]|nr:hypothetical protein [Acidobacteriota bacterium]MCA1638597.1 hypothetical protein [Acidobacteriota bacterium]
MNKILILIATLFLAVCGGAPADQTTPSSEPVKQARGETATGQSSGIDVKVTRNGEPLAAFQSPSDFSGVGAQLVKDHLSIEITSPDNKWVLTIDVPGAKAGVFPLSGAKEAGKSTIILLGDDLFVRASAGELKLNEVSESFCSGTFTGTGTDTMGNKYSYEGKFSRVKVIREE